MIPGVHSKFKLWAEFLDQRWQDGREKEEYGRVEQRTAETEQGDTFIVAERLQEVAKSTIKS